VEILSPQFGLAALEIIVINILLSGDNAVVIALACRNLPKKQRRLGIFYGVIGAVVLRIGFTFFAVKLMLLPFVQLVGAALLLWIGVKLIAEDEDAGEGPAVNSSDRLFAAVKTVIIADLVMSIDNVIGVAAAAKGSLLLLVFGLVVSIPLVVVGSQLIMKLIERYSWLVIAGGGLLGYIAGEIATQDAVVKSWVDETVPQLHWIAPTIGVAIVVVGGLWQLRRAGRAKTT
jgi:YjbE family integral membrane protein